MYLASFILWKSLTKSLRTRIYSLVYTDSLYCPMSCIVVSVHLKSVISSNDHLVHIFVNIFRFHSNRYLTLTTPREQFILKSNATEGKENTQMATCYAYIGCYGNRYLRKSFFTLLQPSICISKAKVAIIWLWESILFTMATVAIVTESKYEGPKAHLHAKFHCDRAVNPRDRNATDRQIDNMYCKIIIVVIIMCTVHCAVELRGIFKNHSIKHLFQNSLAELMSKMQSAEPHFVRCIKPNMQKTAAKFDVDFVRAQLRYTGVMETVRIRQQGYAMRLTAREFLDRSVYIT